MLREELQQLSTAARDLRRFGLVVGGVLAALGLWFCLKEKPSGPWIAGAGGLLVLLGAAWPRVLRYIYLAWMALALGLGAIVTAVLLTLLFFLVVTPIGLAARLMGKDFLSRQLDRRAGSYWQPRDEAARQSPGIYERQW